MYEITIMQQNLSERSAYQNLFPWKFFIQYMSFQIAAKIGGDGVPSVSNNGGAESYPFAAQKRSLEEAG